mmetsp:Transcript_3365/g.5141  ORF Transcript_3365/g.5141 Transcript_3365/m.5141 type:complete len:82 (+) Transcript_3365:726-971(+)
MLLAILLDSCKDCRRPSGCPDSVRFLLYNTISLEESIPSVNGPYLWTKNICKKGYREIVDMNETDDPPPKIKRIRHVCRPN